MQVAKTKVLCTIDNNSIGIGDIDTILHDGGRQKHIVVVVREVENNLLQFLGFHLTMTDGHTTIGDILMNHLLYMCQVTDTVIHEIDLSITTHLKVDGIGDNLGRESVYLRLNRITIRRRRLDDAEVTGPDK